MTRDWVDKATIIRCEVGSGIHGIAEAGKDDRDEMGICIEPYELAQGIRETFEQHIYRSAAVRENQHDAPSQPGDLDLTIYSLRKWVRLALKGNPTVITLLFSPSYIVCDARGSELLKMAPCFASRTAGAHYLGYLQAQRQRLLGERGQKNVNRRELVEQFGFDTKYAGHMLRLGYQGVEFLETGRLTLPMREAERERVRAVRRGEVTLNDVLTETGELEVRLRDLYTTSPLPEKPNTAVVEQWMLDTYYSSWQATYGHARELRKRVSDTKATFESTGSPHDVLELFRLWIGGLERAPIKIDVQHEWGHIWDIDDASRGTVRCERCGLVRPRIDLIKAEPKIPPCPGR